MAETPYEPLPRGTRSIRLLELLPAANPTDPLRCTLQIASFADSAGADAACPKYRAVSYAWREKEAQSDSNDRKAVVICNDRPISVPANLAHLLIRLRLHSQQQSVTLWADSICINQADLGERSEQVSLMKDIFRRSDGIIIWLGETEEVTGLSEPQWTWTGDHRDQSRIDTYQHCFENLKHLQGNVRRGASDDVGAFCLLSRLCQIGTASDIAFYTPHNSAAPRDFAWANRVTRALWRMAERAWVSLLRLYQPMVDCEIR